MNAHGNQSIAVMLSTYTNRTFIVVFIVNAFLLIYKAFEKWCRCLQVVSNRSLLWFSAVSSLCEGSCKVVNHIGQGLCNVLDVAIGALTITERATAWVGRAIDFVLTKLFRVYRLDSCLTLIYLTIFIPTVKHYQNSRDLQSLPHRSTWWRDIYGACKKLE